MKRMLMINAAIAAGLAAKIEQLAAVRPASLQHGPDRRAVRVVYPSPFGR